MEKLNIRKRYDDEKPPMSLLLLADPSKDAIIGYLERGACYIAEKDNKVIGVYVLAPMEKGKVELKNVAVSEEVQGAGIGKQLVLHAVKTARDNGFTEIEVGTGNSSINQLALYQKCGFRISRIIHDFFVKHYDEEIFENGIQCRDMIMLGQKL